MIPSVGVFLLHFDLEFDGRDKALPRCYKVP